MTCSALLQQLQHEGSFLIGSLIGVTLICAVSCFKGKLFKRGRRRRSNVIGGFPSSSSQVYRLVPLGATCIANNTEMMFSPTQLSLSQRGTEEAARDEEEHIYNSFLMGAYDTDTRRWQSVCWVDYGLTREMRKSISCDLRSQCSRVTRREDYDVHEDDECHVWFEPRHVWNIQTEKLYLSSRSKCAIQKTGASNQGIGLRFPRFKRIILSGNHGVDERAEQTAASSDEMFNALNEQEESLNSSSDERDSEGHLQISSRGSAHEEFSAPSSRISDLHNSNV